MSAVSILPIGPFNMSFSYESDRELVRGDVVEIPFGRNTTIGVVTADEVDNTRELKAVSRVFNCNIGSTYCDFIDWMASYTFIPRGNVLKMVLSEKTVFTVKKTMQLEPCCAHVQEIELNEMQHDAYDVAISERDRPLLLHGVTGSGKTEVYLAVAQHIFAQSKQVLILFPEIALTAQISARIEKYFGFKPYIWNSTITPKRRREIWLKAISGEPCIVVGARSSLFLPFQNLGLVIIDEEHDASYKQEDAGCYNARDMAVVLCKLSKISLILSSATPSLESYINAKNGKYAYAMLDSRFGGAQMPSLQLIDMRQNTFRGYLSPTLVNKIKETIANGEQCLIYVNRRGYSPITLCKSCGEKIECPNCTSWLVYHKQLDKLICHYCGHYVSMPKECKCCGGEYIQYGVGVERVFEELQEKIPQARIQIASSDTMNSANNIEQVLSSISKHEVDIIVGTQIFAKGHHFPLLTLVGVVDGDLGLHGADLRAAEKTYQLMHQVSGRAGRGEKPGSIIIQTFNPQHSLYVALQSQNNTEFLDLEVENRRANRLPPYSHFAALIISGTNRELTQQVAFDLKKRAPKDIMVFGPAPAPIFLCRGRVRWRFLLQSAQKKSINFSIRKWILDGKTPKNVKIQIDIDPITFL